MSKFRVFLNLLWCEVSGGCPQQAKVAVVCGDAAVAVDFKRAQIMEEILKQNGRHRVQTNG